MEKGKLVSLSDYSSKTSTDEDELWIGWRTITVNVDVHEEGVVDDNEKVVFLFTAFWCKDFLEPM